MSKAEARFKLAVPDGDDRERRMCERCDFIDYVNPRIVVGSIATWEDKILICKRAIEPRLGFWTLPAGFMETGETVEEAACREAEEEACADLEIERTLAIYSIPRISQVQIMFKAKLRSPDVAPGPESQEVKLVTWNEIPWADMAFPSAVWALKQWHSLNGETFHPPFGNPSESDHMTR
ncbi:MAG: NUDIX hydrolase [Ponticaulis sp.]|nr:NUDIX hydrolase [Ponticaulis sp.]